LILVLGIDAATWTVIRPNLNRLDTFRRLCETGRCTDMVLKETPVSPLIWCSMFCGRTFEEHGHDSFVKGDKIIKREDIAVEFIWDVLAKKGKKIVALNVPFVVPTFSFGTDFRPVGFGLPTDEKEWQDELDQVTGKVKELLSTDADVLIAVYTLLDRVQHFHWGEDCVLDWYGKLDAKLGEVLFNSGFLSDKNNKLILVSDHGFCSFGEAKIQTLPKETKHGTLKGDHHENAIAITVNVDRLINQPQDVYTTICESYWQAENK
jgi:predicted AlkP superfamily phosphohydrolase/phosphomutase